ncbi:glucocorticoid modulatory element-binding protein 2 isoform X1 [Fundulus heteroclitus]|uniref:Glucocorticoid modulatory element binding protein 2 n=1 Tax=Fundulus heteroclitus TaxID=8078 RepID=A0A3Q2QPF8_FUNHE|nr:glucocorticoid modulatory element-binding protein 2 isoform X1 [Fundulus heteroclitus]XP_021168850.1 glucocorticoid modulatory element-binding protein 2 isoform X1 [Fundulus heteroclitus]XP_021168852.1 glucocorticoid modulatory element-binding protein 2 isoform X1 [Fundulus heteroclitus]
MASSDVSIPEMSEVVIVTIPEPLSNELPSVVEEDKAVLVTTELTPQTGEDVLTVAPGEAETEATADSLSKEEAVIVKLSEEVDVEADVFYPITCGDAKATLVWKKFVCPGINVKCVQFNDQLISPKEFVCLAGKSTLKDWKRAIRLNGTMLRKIMDSGELDFYQHTKVCSNTCRSTKIDLVGTKVSVNCNQSADLLSSTASSADLNGAAVSIPDATEEPSEWVTTIREDAVVFWRSVKEAGLLQEVVQDFQKEVQEVLKRLQERVCDPPVEVKDAVLLNNIVQNFGMLDLVKKVLASHKSQMDQYREQYTRSLAALEQQCDEHRKRAKELKSKSQHLNNVLMNLTPVPSPPAPKRPRLTRAISGPAAVNASSAQIALPLSQLGKALTVAGAQTGNNLSSYTLMTSPVSGSELGADGSNVTVLSTAAGQGAMAGSSTSGTFVKVVRPQFQLVTLPLASMQNPTVPQQVSNVTVVNATVTPADESQEQNQAYEDDEGQPQQVAEDEEERQ